MSSLKNESDLRRNARHQLSYDNQRINIAVFRVFSDILVECEGSSPCFLPYQWFELVRIRVTSWYGL